MNPHAISDFAAGHSHRQPQPVEREQRKENRPSEDGHAPKVDCSEILKDFRHAEHHCQQNQRGCNYIQAINEFIATGTD